MSDFGRLQAESHVHEHVPAERADLFHSYDGGSTEFEYLSLLRSLILVLKPDLVLETGVFRGVGTLTIAQALKYNGHRGRLISLDRDLQWIDPTRKLIESDELPATVLHIDSIDYLETTSHVFDFAFFDSDLFLRARECEIAIARGILKPGAFFALHDTSRARAWSQSGPDPATKQFWDLFETLPVRWLEFPYSRGMVVGQVK